MWVKPGEGQCVVMLWRCVYVSTSLCPLLLLYFYPEYQGLCPRWSCSSPAQHLFGPGPGKQLMWSSRDAATMVAGSLPVSYLSSEVGGANVRVGALTGWYEVSSWECKGGPGLTHCWSPSSPLICCHPLSDHPACAVQCSSCWNAFSVTTLYKIPHIESHSVFSRDHRQSQV